MDNQTPQNSTSSMSNNSDQIQKPESMDKAGNGQKERETNKWFLLLVLLFAFFLFIIFLLFMNSRNNEKQDSFIRIRDDEQNQESDESTLPTTTTTPTEEEDEEPPQVEMDIYFVDREAFEAAEDDIFVTRPRITTRLDVAAFGVEQIIEGPTPEEEAENLIPLFGLVAEGAHVEFTSESDCGGEDFTISIVGGDATVSFCRATLMAGDVSGSFVTNTISMTINQFATVDQTRVLDAEGQCFGDLAGLTPDECYY